MAIGKGSKLRHADDVVACKLDGGNALLDLATSDYYRLNSTAALIWDGIGEGLAIPQIIDRIMSEYEVDHDQCSADVGTIVSDLADAGLVVASD